MAESGIIGKMHILTTIYLAGKQVITSSDTYFRTTNVTPEIPEEWILKNLSEAEVGSFALILMRNDDYTYESLIQRRFVTTNENGDKIIKQENYSKI